MLYLIFVLLAVVLLIVAIVRVLSPSSQSSVIVLPPSRGSYCSGAREIARRKSQLARGIIRTN